MTLQEQLKELMGKKLSTEEIVKALTDAGHDQDAIQKSLETVELGEDEMAKALAELDDLSKAEDDDIDDLLKALEAEEALFKSEDEDEGEDEEDEEDDEGEEDVDKSLDEEMDDLIKASQAFNELEESLHKSMGDIHMQLGTLQKSQLAATNLLIKTAKAVAQLAKSMQSESGAAPTRNRAVLGFGKEAGQEEIAKSRGEIQNDLQKAVSEGRVNASYMSKFAVKGVSALPDHVKKEIGLI